MRCEFAPIAKLTSVLLALPLLLAIALGCHRDTNTVASSGPETQLERAAPEPEPIVIAETQVVQENVSTPTAEEVTDPKIWLAKAEQALSAGDVPAAAIAIRKTLSLEPTNPQYIFLRAIILGREHRFPEAVMMLDDLANAVPETRLPALGQTAEWLVLQGQWEQAEARYRAVLDVVPDAAMAHRQLASLLIRQGRQAEAAIHLDALCQVGNIEEIELRALLSLSEPFAADLSRDQLEPIGPLGKAKLALSRGDWQTARQELQEAASTSPAESGLMGRIDAQQNDFTRLESWAKRQPQPETETADSWYARGVLAAHEQQHRDAVICWCKSLLRDATNARVYTELAKSLDQLSATSEAETAKQRAQWLARTHAIGNQMAESDQRDLETLAELADLLDKLHRPLEALSWRAVRIAYGRSSIPQHDQQTELVEINRQRITLLDAPQPTATPQFILCDVDLAEFEQAASDNSPTAK